MSLNDLPALLVLAGVGLASLLGIALVAVVAAALGAFGGGLGKHGVDRFIAWCQARWRGLKAASEAKAQAKIAREADRVRAGHEATLRAERVDRRVRNQTRPGGKVRFGTIVALWGGQSDGVTVEFDGEPELAESKRLNTRWSFLTKPEAEQLAAARHDFPDEPEFLWWVLDPADDPLHAEAQ